MASTSHALVIDNGSGMTKAGFGGETTPTLVYPSIVGRPNKQHIMFMNHNRNKHNYGGEEAMSKRGIFDWICPIKNSIITDWDGMEKLWHELFYYKLKVLPSDYNVLLTEKSPLNTPQNRNKMMEIMYEKFDISSLFIASQTILSIYASGRTTGVVLDCGNTITNIVPINQGFPLLDNSMQLEIGGRQLTDYLVRIMTERGYSFTTNAEKEIARDVKEKLSYVARDWDTEYRQSVRNSSDIEKNYELPDGQVITVGNERFRTAEVLFQPMLMGIKKDGIGKLIYQSINKCDKDIRNELYQNIVLSGGTTMINQMNERLTTEIVSQAPASISSKIKVTAPSDRKYSVFVGGSILSSLSLFEQLWMTKKEYSEQGNRNGNEKKENNDKNEKNGNKGFECDWNLRFSKWNRNKMDNCCVCSIESFDYLPIKNQVTKDELKLILNKQIKYVCFGFVRQNNTNPTDIADIIIKYFGYDSTKFVVRNDSQGKCSVAVCASN